MNNSGYGKGTASGAGWGTGGGTGGASGWGDRDGWTWAHLNSSGRGRKGGSGNDLWTNRDGFGCGISSGRAIRLTQVGLYRRTVANGNGDSSGWTYTDSGWEMY